MGEKFRRATQFNLGMVGKKADTITELLRLFYVLSCDDNHAAFPAGSDELPHGSLLGYVHAICWRVEKNHFGATY